MSSQFKQILTQIKNYKYYQAQFEKFIEQPGIVDDVLTSVQNKTQVRKAHIAYGVSSAVALWLTFGFGAQLLCNLIGFLFPAYKSIKALESSTKEDDTQWLMYWVVFSFFSVTEFTLAGWLPMYWLVKCAFLLWCMFPLQGSSVIYNHIIRPHFLKHESAVIDAARKWLGHVGEKTDPAEEKLNKTIATIAAAAVENVKDDDAADKKD